MKKPISFLFSVSLLILLSLSVLGQTAELPLAEPSYEAVLHVLHGSHEKTTATALPRSLGDVTKQIRSGFDYEGYSLVNTHFARIANTGNVGFNGISSLKGTDVGPDATTFVNWQIGSLRNVRSEAGRDVLQMQSFRFTTRVPVKTVGSAGVINYEPVGMDLGKLALAPNSPTLLGTLSLPKDAGTLFLVMTVRPVGD